MTKPILTKEELKEKIREICTYHSELGEGTSGYSLSEEQFEKLFDLLSQQKRQWREEVLKVIKKKSDVRKAKPEGDIEKGYDYGYDDKTEELLKELEE